METAEHATSESTEAGGDGELVVGRYRLARRLGSGGFGVVWLAHDLELDRSVAVKRIPVGDPDVARRARREGMAAARLQHPAIVALHEAVSDDQAVYLVSELVRGPTYGQLLDEGALSDRDVVAIGVAMCDALTHAHRRGVVHRDVKPQNVLVPDSSDGGPPAKLTDFGVARIAGDEALTRTGDVVGTLAYMAPEQAEGREAGPAADLYALALCLYEGLSGVNPVRARGAAATVRRVGQRLPPLGRLRRDLPLELCAAIDAAVWPHEDERGRIADLRAALVRARDDVGDEPGTIAGAPLEPIAPVAPPVRTPLRTRALAAALAAGLVAVALARFGPVPPVSPAAGAAAAGLAVGLLPRVGWAACAAALALWLAGPQPGSALLVTAAAAPVALILRRAPAASWSVPAAAPVLGLAGLAGAFPVVAGQLARPLHRAAVGALGAWWVLLAEAALDRRIVLGAPHGAAAGTALEDSSGRAADTLGAVLTSPAAPVALVWAAAALVLPLLVRGRSVAVDVVAATLWAAGLASATEAVAGRAPHGLVAGAVLAGVLAVVVRSFAERPVRTELP